jgi:hypothetical protein
MIPFTPTALGRVEFAAEVQTGNRLSLDTVYFKLDSGSDFTTLSCEDLESLAFPMEELQKCPICGKATTASGEMSLQYLEKISIKFGNRELQGCRIYFALGTALRSLLGNDILKYFNREIDYDCGELRLKGMTKLALLLKGEEPIQIYALER